MAKDHDKTNVTTLPLAERKPMALDEAALEAARHSLDQGAATPSSGPWRSELIKLLNDSLATELVCAVQGLEFHRPLQSTPALEQAAARVRDGNMKAIGAVQGHLNTAEGVLWTNAYIK